MEVSEYILITFVIGNYWLDPNGGCETDAFIATCNFTSKMVETCIYPKVKTSARKNWVINEKEEYIWFIKDILGSTEGVRN